MLGLILKNGNAFVNGQTLMGDFEEIGIPAINQKMEEFQPTLAGIEVGMGLETLKGEMTLTAMSPKIIGLVGLRNKYIPIRLLGSLEDELTGKISQAKVEMTGQINGCELSAIKNGEKPAHKITYSVIYLKLSISDEVVQEIDLLNHKWLVDGKDQWAEMREALEIG